MAPYDNSKEAPQVTVSAGQAVDASTQEFEACGTHYRYRMISEADLPPDLKWAYTWVAKFDDVGVKASFADVANDGIASYGDVWMRLSDAHGSTYWTIEKDDAG
jgi:hypothetical protein